MRLVTADEFGDLSVIEMLPAGLCLDVNIRGPCSSLGGCSGTGCDRVHEEKDENDMS
jgi:hypothetical protein